MRRFVSFLLRNWPLKLGALALATVLYAGVVLSENNRLWPGQVPIDVLNPPANAAVLTVLPDVTGIQYRAPLEVASVLTNGSFQASIDLSHVQPVAGGPAVEVPVQLLAVDGHVIVVDYTPQTVKVVIEPVISQSIPITVDHGVVPEGLTIGPPEVDPSSVTVRGASSRVLSVHSLTARVTIDASAINVDEEVAVLALDDTGNPVPGVELTPDRVRVNISVARQLAFATVPIVPQITGTVADGYVIRSVSVAPLTTSVSGEAPAVTRLSSIETAPIDVTGRTGAFGLDTALAPPAEITVGGPATVHVTVDIEPAEGSRTFSIGLALVGAHPDESYALSVGSVLVTLSGPEPVLDALDAGTLHGDLDVAGMVIGEEAIPIAFSAPDGTELMAIDPQTVTVTAAVTPLPSPSPSPLLTPSPSPSQAP